MYEDIEDMRKMIEKAKEEKYPLPEGHLDDLERMLKHLQILEDAGTDWGTWTGVVE
jgi:hypothetical protein